MSVYDPTRMSDQGRNVRDQGNNQDNPFGFGGQGYGAWERSYNLNPDFGWARNQGLSALDFRNRVLENNPAGGGGQNMELANMLRDIGVPDYVGSEGWDRWTNEFGQGGDWGWMQDQGIGPAGALELIRERNPDHWTRQFFMDSIASPQSGGGQDGGLLRQGGEGGQQSGPIPTDTARRGGGGGLKSMSSPQNQNQRFRGGGRTPQAAGPNPRGAAPRAPRMPSPPRGGPGMRPKIPTTGLQPPPGGSPGGPGTPGPPQGRPQINPQVAAAIMMLMNGRRPGGRGGPPRGGGAPRPMGPTFRAGRRRDTPFFFF